MNFELADRDDWAVQGITPEAISEDVKFSGGACTHTPLGGVLACPSLRLTPPGENPGTDDKIGGLGRSIGNGYREVYTCTR